MVRKALESYIEFHLSDEVSSIDESTQLHGLAGELEMLGHKYTVNVDSDVSLVAERADEREIEENEAAESQMDRWREDRYFEREEIEDIENMFDTLVQS